MRIGVGAKASPVREIGAAPAGGAPAAGAAIASAPPAGLEPYRVLFPLGILYAVVAALVWPLYVGHLIRDYPAQVHWTLMIQGFIHCFVLGFLLTALPGFLHADRCRPAELWTAVTAMLALGICALAGWTAAAQAAYLVTLMTLTYVAVRRFPVRRGDPPEEFLFVALGLLFGYGGALWGVAVAAGWAPDAAPRFALHLIERGFILCVVLGVGGLLVPTFTAMKDPMAVPGVAKPGQRAPRRRAYLPIAALFVASLVAEGSARPGPAAWIRVAAVTPLLILVWKIIRLPGRRDLLSFALWAGGWFILIGIWFAALSPAHAIAGFHLAFLGGFALLILGIATRVVVTHGKFPLQHERRLLTPRVVALVVLALALRMVGEFVPGLATHFWAGSGTLWTLAWIDWGLRAVPCMIRKASETLVMERLKYQPGP
ncbi:MAG TPA: NnrS family protein [Candidatus Eisenbacteria bacterium]